MGEKKYIFYPVNRLKQSDFPLIWLKESFISSLQSVDGKCMIQLRALSDVVFHHSLNLPTRESGGTKQQLQTVPDDRFFGVDWMDRLTFSRGEFCRRPRAGPSRRIGQLSCPNPSANLVSVYKRDQPRAPLSMCLS
jgi:hypothetical protein